MYGLLSDIWCSICTSCPVTSNTWSSHTSTWQSRCWSMQCRQQAAFKISLQGHLGQAAVSRVITNSLLKESAWQQYRASYIVLYNIFLSGVGSMNRTEMLEVNVQTTSGCARSEWLNTSSVTPLLSTPPNITSHPSSYIHTMSCTSPCPSLPGSPQCGASVSCNWLLKSAQLIHILTVSPLGESLVSLIRPENPLQSDW